MILLKDSPIEACCFLIVGLEGETEETVNETIDFVKELQRIKPLYYKDINIAMIYPGTKIYDLMKNGGVIDDKYWLTENEVPFFTLEHTKQKLYEFKDKILSNVAGLKGLRYE